MKQKSKLFLRTIFMIEILISLVACLSAAPKSSKKFDVLKQQKPENFERNKDHFIYLGHNQIKKLV